MSVARRLPLLAAALHLAACGSVGPSIDSAQEGDEVRDQALAVYVDRTITDRLDGPEGDNTDWKYVDIVEQGRLRLVVNVDTPDRLLGGEVGFFDEFGNRLDRSLVLANQTTYVFATEVEKIPNKFFVRVFAKDGTSVYSVGATLSPKPAPPPPKPYTGPVVEVPEAPPPPPKRAKPRARRPSKRPPPVKPPPPPPPVEPAATSVRATVVRALPAADGQSVTLHILLPKGKKLAKRSGTLYRDGAPIGQVRITKGSVGRVYGVIATPPGKVTGARLEVEVDVE
ncbi:MAG: hypothetical protein H6704_01355 [Myxococcales bacterium]|nr:hypothetical protein [Myxococcales bacterium]